MTNCDELENEPVINLQTMNKDIALIHTEESWQENPEKIHGNETVTGVTSYDISLQQPSISTGVQGTVQEFHPMTLDAVSYTHLDVYKRQVHSYFTLRH